MSRFRKILRNLVIVALIAVIGASVGYTARVFLDHCRRLARAEGRDIPGAAEIQESGRRYSIVPLAAGPQTPAELEALAAVLRRHAVDYRIVDGKMMVEDDRLKLAVDALQAAGVGGEARHFSFQEITADPEKEPERHALQERLATQNTLANLITLLSADIADARVVLDPEAAAATVRLRRRALDRPLAPELLEDIRRHVRAMAGDVRVTVETEK